MVTLEVGSLHVPTMVGRSSPPVRPQGPVTRNKSLKSPPFNTSGRREVETLKCLGDRTPVHSVVLEVSDHGHKGPQVSGTLRYVRTRNRDGSEVCQGTQTDLRGHHPHQYPLKVSGPNVSKYLLDTQGPPSVSGKWVPPLGGDRNGVRIHPSAGQSEKIQETPSTTKELLRVGQVDLLGRLLEHTNKW